MEEKTSIDCKKLRNKYFLLHELWIRFRHLTAWQKIDRNGRAYTWPKGPNNCFRSFSVASKATFLTINFVELVSFSIFLGIFSSFLLLQSCKMRACPSRTVPWSKYLKGKTAFWKCRQRTSYHNKLCWNNTCRSLQTFNAVSTLSNSMKPKPIERVFPFFTCFLTYHREKKWNVPPRRRKQNNQL